jgi:hypothetical protein
MKAKPQRSSLVRIAQISLSFSGAFWPTRTVPVEIA